MDNTGARHVECSMLALVIMSDEGQVFSSRKALAGVNLAYGMANELLVDLQLAQFVPDR
jgi:hypothetical protein